MDERRPFTSYTSGMAGDASTATPLRTRSHLRTKLRNESAVTDFIERQMGGTSKITWLGQSAHEFQMKKCALIEKNRGINRPPKHMRTETDVVRGMANDVMTDKTKLRDTSEYLQDLLSQMDELKD